MAYSMLLTCIPTIKVGQRMERQITYYCTSHIQCTESGLCFSRRRRRKKNAWRSWYEWCTLKRSATAPTWKEPMPLLQWAAAKRHFLCVVVCKSLYANVTFCTLENEWTFHLKRFVRKKGHKAYASGSGSTHILIWVKIAMRERINPVYERNLYFL